MEDKIEVGEYVRTEGGLIAKYLGFEKDKHLFDNEVYWYYEYYIECVYEEDWKQFKEDIVKHSKQLIDLIGCGDYVNGELITDKWDTRISSIRSNFSEEDIKTILTKEQYIANCYKVEGGEE